MISKIMRKAKFTMKKDVCDDCIVFGYEKQLHPKELQELRNLTKDKCCIICKRKV